MAFTPKFLEEEKKTKEKDFLSVVTIDASGLPSMGKPYPEGSKIRYKPFVFGEVKKISSSVNLTQKDVFNIVMDGIEADFDKYLLTINDVLYIGILRKISTLGTSKFNIEFSCTSCKEKNKLVVESTDLNFDEMMAKKLPVIANIGGQDFKFTPITVRDFLELIDDNKHTDEIYVFSKQCRNLPLEKAYEFIYNCSPNDASIFDKVDRYLSHKLKPLETKCKKCEKPLKISLDGGQALMLPFRESGEPVGNGIRFGDEDEC